LVQSSLLEVAAYFEAHYATFDEDSRSLQGRFRGLFGIEAVFGRWRELLKC
jgi:hypothetical protein